MQALREIAPDMLKRAFDFTASLSGLILLWPLIVILALVIRRSSEGPGILSQTRIGRNGRPFQCYKLRTMYRDTQHVPTHAAAPSSITPIGAVLRRTKLDELPQLWNVVKGDMSLVGPRPCLPSQAELIAERETRGVLALRPGITGLAQVSGIDMSEPVRLAETDADYLRRQSLGLDAAIIFRTFFRGGNRSAEKLA